MNMRLDENHFLAASRALELALKEDCGEERRMKIAKSFYEFLILTPAEKPEGTLDK